MGRSVDNFTACLKKKCKNPKERIDKLLFSNKYIIIINARILNNDIKFFGGFAISLYLLAEYFQKHYTNITP